MRYVVTIEMDNEAFHDSETGTLTPGTEVARILRWLAKCAQSEALDQRIMDVNGNTVGTAAVED